MRENSSRINQGQGKTPVFKLDSGRWDCNRRMIAPSGSDSEILSRVGIHCADRLLQAGAHFFFFISAYAAFVEAQHFVPKLYFSLEQVSPGRFHIFCPIRCRVLTREIFWKSS